MGLNPGSFHAHCRARFVLGIWRLRWGIIPVVGGSAILGLIYRMAARALGGIG